MANISDCATLKFGLYNCQGLSKVKKDLALSYNCDILCLTEVHSWRENDENKTIYSDLPPKSDSWSGVALHLSPRVSKYVIDSGPIGSRITFCRLRGNITNYFIIGVYVPQRKRRNPNQAQFYDQLESLLEKIPKHDCVVLMGDFNSRLARNESGYVGRWCIHTRRDSGGDRLLEVMRKFSLRCVSTYFQPKRRHSNATYMNIQPGKAPSQIDYILISSRWATGARNCKTAWGLPIAIHGRKYDHAFLTMSFKLRLQCDRRRPRKDFSALKDPKVREEHDKAIKAELDKTPRPNATDEQLRRLNKAMRNAQSSIPKKQSNPVRKWESSPETMILVDKRKQLWDKLNNDEKDALRREIGRSARNDYRNYMESIITEMEKANAVGNSSETYRLAKKIATKGKTTLSTQPSKDDAGNPITSNEHQLELWANFLDDKFAAQPGEPEVVLHSNNEEEVPPPSLDEVKACVKKLSNGKGTGPDEVPIEQYQSSEIACEELWQVIQSSWETEEIPEEFVLADMMMIYKKKSKDLRSNYRALGLLNHSYKTLSMVLLQRIVPYIEPNLSDMQAGFRKGRGCRDNLLILTMAIHHLLKNVQSRDETAGIITYIDFVAAFDSINHSYMLESLKKYNVPLKYIRLVKAIYSNAAVRVRIQEIGGSRSYSRAVPIRRGAIQGDIPSPVVFLVALDRLLKEHGGVETGISITPELTLSDLEFADDAALGNNTTDDASERVTNLDEGAAVAGMSISKPKTKAQHIRHRPEVSATSEADIDNLPETLKFQFACPKCERVFPTSAGLGIHRGRWCKGRKTAKKPSRKGTVADRIITRMKVENHQNSLPKVKIGQHELENVYSFVYLGSEIAADSDQQVTLKHRCDIAWGRFSQHRTVLTSTKLPVNLRLRFYAALIVMTMVYGSSAWFFTVDIRKRLNNVSSKMLSSITKRTIHAEARAPSFNVIDHVLNRRRSYLGHILRADQNRMVRRYLLELSPDVQPFIEGSLLEEAGFSNTRDMIEAAVNRDF